MSMKLQPLDSTKAISELTTFINETVKDAGFNKVVLGLSGGVDSALSAFLSVQALGSENVLCLRMPYKTSSEESLTHAQLVIDRLGGPSKTIDISPPVDAILENYPDASRVRQGNIMARVRMINVYDHSAALPGLVVGTGNKTEILLGYSTLHGDGAFDFNPLADLYKYQVRQLAGDLGVPQEIITKAPSADLWTGQTDEGELGYTYQEIDQLLVSLVEKKLSPEECIKGGFSEEFVRNIIDRVNRYRYKSLMPKAGSIGQFQLSRLEEIAAFSK
jgi:NAD+ synthase